jgi:hypothetical protein
MNTFDLRRATPSQWPRVIIMQLSDSLNGGNVLCEVQSHVPSHPRIFPRQFSRCSQVPMYRTTRSKGHGIWTLKLFFPFDLDIFTDLLSSTVSDLKRVFSTFIRIGHGDATAGLSSVKAGTRWVTCKVPVQLLPFVCRCLLTPPHSPASRPWRSIPHDG